MVVTNELQVGIVGTEAGLAPFSSPQCTHFARLIFCPEGLRAALPAGTVDRRTFWAGAHAKGGLIFAGPVGVDIR